MSHDYELFIEHEGERYRLRITLIEHQYSDPGYIHTLQDSEFNQISQTVGLLHPDKITALNAGFAALAQWIAFPEKRQF